MAITAELFKARFPEFLSEADARIDIIIGDTINIYIGDDEKKWNGKYDYAQAYLSSSSYSC